MASFFLWGIGLCGVVLNCVKSVNPEYFDKSCQKRVITLQPENTNVKKNSFIMARRRKKSESETALYDTTKSFIDNFEVLVSAAEYCELKEEFFEQYRGYIDAACDVLHLTEQEVIVLCPFLKNSDKVYDFGDISNFYDCTTMKIMRYVPALKMLAKKGYIKKVLRHGIESFKISYKALETISQGKGMEDAVQEEELTPMEFMRKMNDWFEDKRRDNIDWDTLEEEIMNLLRNNLNFNITSRVFNMPLSKEDKIKRMLQR